MRAKRNARILVLSLFMATVYSAGWAQDSGQGGDAQNTRPAQADSAVLGVQKAPDSRQESARMDRFPIAIVPFIFDYQHAGLYFRQTIEDSPDYIRIEAMIQDGPSPIEQLSLTEKEGSQIVYYTNSQVRAEFLSASGKTAHVTPVEYTVENSLGEQTKYTFAFKDRKGRSIRWVFIPASNPDESKPGVALMPQPLKLIYWAKAAMAGEGTAVQIDDKTSHAKEVPELSSPPWYVAYLGNIFIEAVIGGPVSGSKSWQVKTAPQAIGVGEKWVLTDEHNNSRELKIITKQGSEVTVREVKVNGSVSPPLTLDMKETPDGLSLKSISFADGTRSLRLTFMPDLNIAALTRSGKKASISFQMDIGDESKVIEGVLEVERKGDIVELIGRPTSPEEVKPVILKSKITLSGDGYSIESLNNASVDLPSTAIRYRQ